MFLPNLVHNYLREMLVGSQGWELLCVLLSLGAYVAYHVWLFAFETSVPGRFKVLDVAKRGRRVWARAIAEKDSETVTGVQTLRCVAAPVCFEQNNSSPHYVAAPCVYWQVPKYTMLLNKPHRNWHSCTAAKLCSQRSCLRCG